jgi:acetolactate synthase-1/2/3 large subunit
MQTSDPALRGSTRLSPSQAVVSCLREQGVELIFGLDGDHVIYLFDALADAPDIRPITVKHENNAAIAAEVYGRLTGRPGVVLTTAGPGATNALSGVAGAYAAGAPLVHICGGVPRGAPKEAFHGVDNSDFLQRAFEPVTKWSTRIEEAGQIPAALRHAFALAATGRPGPVHVEIALSALQEAAIEVPEPTNGEADRRGLSGENLATLAERIEGAGRVAIVAGKGAWWPAVSAALVKLAERLSAPVAHTWDGQAAMPTTHPLSVGPWGASTGSHPTAARLIAEADCVLGIGVRRGTQAAQLLADEAGDRLVLLNAADQPSALAGLEVGSVAALAEALHRLAAHCQARAADDNLLARCARARELLQRGLQLEIERHRATRPWHIGLALDALARQMTADTLVVSDVSNVKLWAPLQLPVFNPESHLQSGSWAAPAEQEGRRPGWRCLVPDGLERLWHDLRPRPAGRAGGPRGWRAGHDQLRYGSGLRPELRDGDRAGRFRALC